MKLTKSKWLNLAILKITEGLGVVFIPYLIGLIPLAIWPGLQQKLYMDSVFDIWWFGTALILVPIAIVIFVWAIVCQNLDWAKDLKKED